MEMENSRLLVIPEDAEPKEESQKSLRALDAFLREHWEAYRGDGRRRGQALLVSPDGQTTMEVPEPVYRALLYVVHHMARGDAVSVVPLQAQLTTQQAADLLNVSRPFVIKLLDEGEIPYTKTGTHRRIKLRDLLAYKERRHEEALRALSEMAREAQELGIY